MFYRPLSFCFACLMAICLPVLAEQDVDSDTKVSAPRVLTIADADDWQRVRQFVLSPNGE